jgi:hypothetical protein
MRLICLSKCSAPEVPTTSSGEQNLDGEPSWNAGGLRAPTMDYDPTWRSNAIVSSKLSFTIAKPDPHEFVKLTVERLLSKLGREGWLQWAIACVLKRAIEVAGEFITRARTHKSSLIGAAKVLQPYQV